LGATDEMSVIQPSGAISGDTTKYTSLHSSYKDLQRQEAGLEYLRIYFKKVRDTNVVTKLPLPKDK
jgi:hypothetical protein